MDEVAGFEPGITVGEAAGPLDIGVFDGPDFFYDAINQGEGVVHRQRPSAPVVVVKNLLKNLRRGHQPLPAFRSTLQKGPGLVPARVFVAHEENEDVSIDKDH